LTSLGIHPFREGQGGGIFRRLLCTAVSSLLGVSDGANHLSSEVVQRQFQCQSLVVDIKNYR